MLRFFFQALLLSLFVCLTWYRKLPSSKRKLSHTRVIFYVLSVLQRMFFQISFCDTGFREIKFSSLPTHSSFFFSLSFIGQEMEDAGLSRSDNIREKRIQICQEDSACVFPFCSPLPTFHSTMKGRKGKSFHQTILSLFLLPCGGLMTHPYSMSIQPPLEVNEKIEWKTIIISQ